MVVVLLFALVGIALAEGPTADASRTIDPKIAERGDDIQVTVVFQNLLSVSKAFSLLEDIPDGWGFTRGTDDASTFRPGPPPEWLWFTVDAGATKTVTYTLTVPMDAAAGNYTIEGMVIDAQNVQNPVEGDTTITVRVLHNLTTSSTAGGSVTTPGEGVYTYDEGTVVDLVATPSAGYRFDEWTGDVGTIADVHAATTTITMNAGYAITADFVKTYDLTMSSTAGGSVTTPGEGTYTYDTGTVVTLLAMADGGYQFAGWSGDTAMIGDTASAATTITMNGDYSVTANFCERPVISLGFNGVEAGDYAAFDYCEGVNLVVTLFEEYAGQAPYTIAWTVAENSTLNGVATVSKGGTLFSHVLDAGVYTVQITSIVDANNCAAEQGFLDKRQATVTVHEPSTYQFIYGIPEVIVACEEAEMPVTFQTSVLGFCGYDGVRYKFYAGGPGAVTFNATDLGQVEHSFLNSGYWDLGVGSQLPASYNETVVWTLHFSTPGDYTVTFSLVDTVSDAVIAGTTRTEALIVESGDILKYYRSLHEPVDEVSTLDLLAAADDWSGHVTPPCFAQPIDTTQLLVLANEWVAAGS